MQEDGDAAQSPGAADGGDACYVRFMPRVRSALGQFYGSVRSALGHVMSVMSR